MWGTMVVIGRFASSSKGSASFSHIAIVRNEKWQCDNKSLDNNISDSVVNDFLVVVNTILP